MKSGKRSKMLMIVFSILLFGVIAGMAAPALATNGGVILHPGYLSGSISLTGQELTQVTVRAIDTSKVYSASVTVTANGGASSIDYTLTVEGDYEYYVIAEAEVVAADYTSLVLPVTGPVFVPIYAVPGDEVEHNMSVTPAFISGTISTTTDSGNTIEHFSINASILVPEFDLYFYSRTYAWIGLQD